MLVQVRSVKGKLNQVRSGNVRPDQIRSLCVRSC